MDPQHPTDPRPETGPDASDPAYPHAVPSETAANLDADLDARATRCSRPCAPCCGAPPTPGRCPRTSPGGSRSPSRRPRSCGPATTSCSTSSASATPTPSTPSRRRTTSSSSPASPTVGHQDDNVVPLLRRRWPLIGVAAAIVAFLAIAGAVVVQQRSSNNGLAAIPPAGSTAGSAGSVHVQISNTAYTKDGLVAGAQTLIASPGPDASVGDAPSAGPLVTQSGAAACVERAGRLGRGSREHRPGHLRRAAGSHRRRPEVRLDLGVCGAARLRSTATRGSSRTPSRSRRASVARGGNNPADATVTAHESFGDGRYVGALGPPGHSI